MKRGPTLATLARARRRNLSRADREGRRRAHMQVMNRDLDAVKEVTGSDAVTALILGVGPSKVSAVRKLKAPLPPVAAVKLAKMLKQPILPALALALSATARSDEARNFWLDLAVGRWP